MNLHHFTPSVGARAFSFVFFVVFLAASLAGPFTLFGS